MQMSIPKPLFPRTYRSRYRTADGRRWFAVWRQWMDRIWDYDCVEVKAADGQ